MAHHIHRGESIRGHIYEITDASGYLIARIEAFSPHDALDIATQDYPRRADDYGGAMSVELRACAQDDRRDSGTILVSTV